MGSLPTEILEKIAINILERPFKTELLLINKTFCGAFMAEQIRNLNLTAYRANRFISTITNTDVKELPSVPQYCNLLNRIFELTINVTEVRSQEPVVRFISRCTNLRLLAIEALSRVTIQWNISIIIDSLHSNIIEISFSGIKLGDEGVQSVTEYVRRSTKLTSLALFGTSIGARRFQILAKCLKQNTILTNLNLSCNSIGDDGVYALAECLKQNTVLANLDLSFNRISDLGAHILTNVLKQNTTLTHLNLRRNEIGNEGACILAEGLRQNTVLTNLDLENNSIGNEGTRALAECLKHIINLNPSLEYDWAIGLAL